MTKSFLSGSVIIAVIVIHIIIPCIAMPLYAQTSRNHSQNIPTPFDVSEIIEQVSHHPINQGDKIVIKNKVYEAFFDESGVVLQARETKENAEDLVIPINGKPEIRDGEIVYRTTYGEIIFEGYEKSLRFKEIYKSPGFNSPITNYFGNVAKLYNEKVTDWSREGEFVIDTNIVYVSVYYEQEYPSIAFDGTNYLVVWADARCDPDRNFHFSYTRDIYGARVDPSGMILDPAGIAISTAAYNQLNPSVTSDGTNYLVVWEDFRNTGSGTCDIYGARVDTSGAVLDPLGVAISTAANNQLNPSVTSDGTNYLVVWEDFRSALNIYGARVDTSGTVLDPLGINISITANGQRHPAIDFDGTNYLVVWQDYRSGLNIYGARVDTSGTVLDTLGIAISAVEDSQKCPSIAFDGTNYLVVWQNYHLESFINNNSDYNIYGARISQSGTVLDSSGIAISMAVNDQNHPSVTFDGTNYLVVWDDRRSDSSYDIYGARVDTLGAVLDPSGISISTTTDNQLNPSVAFNGTNYFIVWHEQHSVSSYDIYGARVDTAGTVLDPSGITVSTAANDQWHPSVAFDGTNYLVVWHDYHSDSSYDIYGVQINQFGSVLNPTGVAISIADDAQKYPSVAFDGSNYLVVWQDDRSGVDSDIYGARVSQSGVVLDPTGIAISTDVGDQQYPVVAFGSVNYLVLWEDSRKSNRVDIYGARIDTSGSVLDPSGFAISIFLPEHIHQYPTVAFDGTNYLVVWSKLVPLIDVLEVYGVRLDVSGNLLDPLGIDISPYTSDEFYPAITFDGTNYLVVWVHVHNIYGVRVNTAGTVIDQPCITITSADSCFQYYPSIVYDDSNYVIVWEEWPFGHMYSDIYGIKLTPQMQVIDSFVVSLQTGNQYLPTLAHGQENQVLITYSSFTDVINSHPANTMRIWGKFYPFVGIEEYAECSTPDAKRLEVYPNPFKNKTDIRYAITDKGPVDLKIYDVTGRIVKNFGHVSNYQSPCNHLVWNGADDYGFRLSAGVYFVKLRSDNFNAVEKIILLQ
jgi:hypothetical protein